jgi:plasmid segregation protein ParM
MTNLIQDMSNIVTRLIDLGNYNTKGVADGEDFQFISTFEEYDSADTSEKKVLVYNDKNYRMEFEKDFDGEYNKALKDYMPNLLWGLDKSGVQNGEHIRLLLGLPITSLGQADKIKNDLVGKSFTFKTTEEKTIHIDEVVIVGEGISSYYMLPKEDREKDLVLIDIGGRTTNVVEYKNKRIVNKDTFPTGTIDFYNRAKNKFNNENGENVETHSVRHYIQQGVIPVYTELEDEFIKELMNKIKTPFNLGLGKLIVFTGGGSIDFRRAIEEYNKNYKFLENPIHSNNKGKRRIAKAKGWL